MVATSGDELRSIMLSSMAKYGPSAGQQMVRDQQQQAQQQAQGALGQLMSSMMPRYSYGGQSLTYGSQDPLLGAFQRALGMGGPRLGTGYGANGGKYAGWKNESDLKAAILGAGERQQSLEQAYGQQIGSQLGQRASAADTAINGLLNNPQATQNEQGAFQDWYKAADAAGAASPQAQYRAADLGWGSTNPADRVYHPPAAPAPPPAPPPAQSGADVAVLSPSAAQQNAASVHQEQAQAAQRNAALAALAKASGLGDQWFGYDKGVQQSADTYQKQVAAQLLPWAQFVGELGQRPVTEYARQAATNNFGVDPNLAEGWFPNAKIPSDFSTARNLESWQQAGMPYSEAVTAANQQAADAQKQADAVDKANQDAIAQAVFNETGVDGRQLAQASNVTLNQLSDTIGSPDYHTANQAIQSAISQRDENGVASVMAAVQQRDPTLARVLETTYKDYMPQGYSFYTTTPDQSVLDYYGAGG